MGRKKGGIAARHSDADRGNLEVDEEFEEDVAREGSLSVSRDEGKKGRRKQQTEQQPRLELDRGTIKAVKICVHCQRPFSWRKKWERCWEEVLTCSNACKRERKRAGALAGDGRDEEDNEEEEDDEESPSGQHRPGTHVEHFQQGDHSPSRPLQPGREDHAKPSTSCRTSSAGIRTKQCNVCGEAVMMAYRCRWDKTKVWRFVCRPCWPKISDTDYLETMARKRKEEVLPIDDDISKLLQQKGTQGNPYYVYGGTWKATIGMTKAEISEMQDNVRRPHTIEKVDGAGTVEDDISKASKPKGKKGGKKNRCRFRAKADEVGEDTEEEVGPSDPDVKEKSGEELEEIACDEQMIGERKNGSDKGVQDEACGA